MPGFRKGKVPMQLIRRQYGQSVLADELNKLLSETLQNHVQENKLNILGNPIPSEKTEDSGDWNAPAISPSTTNWGFPKRFGLRQKGQIHPAQIKVDKDAINKQMEDLCRRHEMTDPDKSEAKDMLVGSFQQLDDAGNVRGGIESVHHQH